MFNDDGICRSVGCYNVPEEDGDCIEHKFYIMKEIGPPQGTIFKIDMSHINKLNNSGE